MCSQPPLTTQEGMAEAVALAAASADVPAHACQAPAFIKSPWSFHQPWLKGTTCRSVTCAAMFPQATTRAWLGLKLWQLPLQTCLSMLAKPQHFAWHPEASTSHGSIHWLASVPFTSSTQEGLKFVATWCAVLADMAEGACQVSALCKQSCSFPGL